MSRSAVADAHILTVWRSASRHPLTFVSESSSERQWEAADGVRSVGPMIDPVLAERYTAPILGVAAAGVIIAVFLVRRAQGIHA